MRSDEPSHRALLDYLSRSDYEPLAQRQLLHRMQVPPEHRPRVRALIRELLHEGRLIKGSGGRLSLRDGDRVVGTLHRHRDGYGFVEPDAGGPDVFIAPPHLGSNLSGDRVAVRVTRRRRGNRLEGVILRTISRRSRRMLGVFFGSGAGGSVQPFEAGLGAPLHVPGSFRGGATERQVVQFEMLPGYAGGGGPHGKVLQVLGDLDAPGMDIRVVARKYGLPMRFPSKVAEATRHLPARVGPRQSSGRTRFDDPPPVTIDGETAKDFDDAISVQRLRDGGFRLFVHIADVAHFVDRDDALDVEARHRGTSVYFPGRVLPMFPEKLSNDLCSLRPGVDRLVQSVVVDFDRRGVITRSRFADGVIRSAARLTYTQVAQVIEGERRVRGVPRRVMPMLLEANRLRQLLERRRYARGSIDFDLPEPQILLDVEGAMTGITIEPRNRAHRLIEEFMIVTNEVVARYLDERIGVCLYRVHEEPQATKLEVLGNFVARFGLSFPAATEAVRPHDFQRLLQQAEGRAESSLINGVALRSMKQARYSTENIGHFSLASSYYCHFTSPIRRYPDLEVHRLLRLARSARGRARSSVSSRDSSNGSSEDTNNARGDRLAQVAEACSELERNAEAAERELLSWKKVAFAEDKVGEVYEGIVSGVTAFGLFLQLEANLVEGLLRVERLGGGRFRFDEQKLELVELGEGDGRRTFRLGDRMRVRIERVDRVLHRVDFALPSLPAPRRRPRGRGRALRAGVQ